MNAEKTNYLALEQANKMIFVKHYDDAAHILDSYLESAGKNNVLAHFRRIELGLRLGDLPLLKDSYSNKASTLDPIVISLCKIFCEYANNKKAELKSGLIGRKRAPCLFLIFFAISSR